MIISLLLNIRASEGTDALIYLIAFLLMLPAMLFALSAHETAHGYCAHLLGDETASLCGRLTLNPFKHFDWKGFLCLAVFGFGWAKPVPIDARNFKNPKWGMALTAFAGPFTNFILGVLNTFLCVLMCKIPFVNGNVLYYIGLALYVLFYYSASINFLYFVFNLIPVPPFDGSRIVSVFLPSHIYFRIMRYERTILYVTLAVLFVLSRLGFSPFNYLADLMQDGFFTLFSKLLSVS